MSTVPTIYTASILENQTYATVTWTAPTSGEDITGYSIISTPTTTTQTTSATETSIEFSGLSYGTTYTFQVAATNASGTGSYSSSSNSVTPYTSAAEVTAPSSADFTIKSVANISTYLGTSWKSTVLYEKDLVKVTAVSKIVTASAVKGLRVLSSDQIVEVTSGSSQLGSLYINEIRYIRLWYDSTLSMMINMLTGTITDIDGQFETSSPSVNTNFTSISSDDFPTSTDFDVQLSSSQGDYLSIQVAQAEKNSVSQILFSSAQSNTEGYSGEFITHLSSNKAFL